MVVLACLLVTVLLAASWFIWKDAAANPLRLIPGPREVPILGSVLAIDWLGLHLQLVDWKSKYGSIMKFSIMGKYVVVISSSEAAKEALVSRGTDFADRPSWYRVQRLGYFKGMIAGKYTPAVAEMRRTMHRQLKAHSDGSGRVEKIIMDEMVELLEHISALGSQPFDAGIETQRFVCNVIATQLYGERYHYDHPVVMEIIQFITAVIECTSPTSPGKELDTFPWLRFTGLFKKPMADLRRLEGLADRLIMSKVKEARISFDASNPRGIVDDLIAAKTDHVDADSHFAWDDKQIVAYLYDFIIAGSTTTSRTMQAAYLVLLKHPEFQVKIQGEIDKVVGACQPSLKNRSEMPYTEAFILEILRYTTIAPLLIPHMTVTDTTVGGYRIPANTRVLVNSWGIHHDDDIYPQPFNFRPERFLNEFGQLHTHDHPSRSNFLVFGAGRRACPGEHFSLARLFLLIVSVLQRFNLSPDESRPAADPDPRRYKLYSVLEPPACFVRAIQRKS